MVGGSQGGEDARDRPQPARRQARPPRALPRYGGRLRVAHQGGLHPGARGFAQHAKVETGPCLQVRPLTALPSSRSPRPYSTRSPPSRPRAPAPHRTVALPHAARRTVHGARLALSWRPVASSEIPLLRRASLARKSNTPAHPGTPRAGARPEQGPCPRPAGRRTRACDPHSSPAPRPRASPRHRPAHRAIHRRHAASGRLRSK